MKVRDPSAFISIRLTTEPRSSTVLEFREGVAFVERHQTTH